MASVGQKLKDYHRELLWQKLKTSVYAIIVAICTAFFIMLFFGDRFDRYLSYLGLEGLTNQIGGVYADCATAENINSPYCKEKKSRYQKNWEQLQQGGSAPFSLSE